MRYDGKRVLIVGLGESGRAAARFFLARGAHVTAADSRVDIPIGDLAGVELHLGRHDDSVFQDAAIIVPSPGVPWSLPQLEAARAAGIEVAGELEIAAREIKGKVIGITGTNGKTTTTAWIGHILKESGLLVQVAGNIGTPVLAIVDDSDDDQWTVLELSSFQLEAMESFRCHIAAVLNLTPDHLDRHGSMESYSAAKAQIIAAQCPEDSVVLNADDSALEPMAQASPSNVEYFSRRVRSDGVWVQDGSIIRSERAICSTDLPLPGPHNLENALAAVAVAACAGVSDDAIATHLATFEAVEHRLEFVRCFRGVNYYNDSKATNVDAAIKAVESFDCGLWVILGGRDKGGDYLPLSNAMSGRTRGALLVGEAAAKIRSQLNGGIPVVELGAVDQAVSYACDHAGPGDTVLLSPACASFDQFESYEGRGRYFKQLVQKLF